MSTQIIADVFFWKKRTIRAGILIAMFISELIMLAIRIALRGPDDPW